MAVNIKKKHSDFVLKEVDAIEKKKKQVFQDHNLNENTNDDTFYLDFGFNQSK